MGAMGSTNSLRWALYYKHLICIPCMHACKSLLYKSHSPTGQKPTTPDSYKKNKRHPI